MSSGNGSSPLDHFGETWEGSSQEHSIGDPSRFEPQTMRTSSSDINPEWTPEDQAAVDSAMADNPHYQNMVKPGKINHRQLYEQMKAAGGW